MNFKDDEDLMKQIMEGGGGGNVNVDDELAALEAEVGGKKGEDDELADLENELDEEENVKSKPKAKKKDSDDELDALEKEGLDDIDDVEEEEKKTQAQKKPTQAQQKPQPKPQPQKEVPKGPDLYPAKTEGKYHNVEKMNSVGVLEKEKEICDKIIAYKKKIGADYDDWDMKKDDIDTRIDTISSFVSSGTWNVEKYKAEIRNQYKWEVKLLQFADKDPTLNEQQKKALKDRVEARKNIIDKELKENPQIGGKEKPKKEEPKKEAPKKEEVVQKDGPDLYPEKTEQKYHNVEKMTSIGCLEKEKELCDKIIEYKKKKGADYDDWDMKKEDIDAKISSVTTYINGGLWDLAKYKQEIANQMKWEMKLSQFVEKDPSLNDQQKKVLKDRIEARKKIIEEEMKQEEEGDEEEEEEEKPKTEEKKKEEPKKEEPKKQIIETKQSLNPMFDVPKEKEEEEKNRLNKVVTDRLNEYRAALDYFQNNELGEQRVDAINKAKLICIELKKIQDGKWKEVNEFKLPDPVTPEYIYGYKKEERNEKFKKIIMDYDKQRKELTAEMTSIIQAIQKLPKQKQKKASELVMKDLNAKKARKQKFDQLINLLKEKFQDSWVPAPLFIEQEKEIKSERINKDIPEFHLLIIFGKTTYSKDKSLYLIVKHEEKNQQAKFDQKSPGNWEHQVDWKYEKGDFKSVWRSKILVEIWEKRVIFKDSLKGAFEMEPKELKDHIEMTKDFPITLESGREGQKATVTFKVRSACKEPEYLTETKTYLQLTKIYPPFNLKGGNNTQGAMKFEVKSPQINPQDFSANTTVKPNPSPAGKPSAAKPQAQPAKPKPAQGGKPAAGPKKPSAPVDKSQFKDEELKDPDCLDNLRTLEVLKFKHAKYEAIRNKIDGRTPRELMQRITRINIKIKQLEESFGDEITPQDYLALLKFSFDHDKKLAEYFKQTGDKDKFTLVNERLPLIVKEMEALIKEMPK